MKIMSIREEPKQKTSSLQSQPGKLSDRTPPEGFTDNSEAPFIDKVQNV